MAASLLVVDLWFMSLRVAVVILPHVGLGQPPSLIQSFPHFLIVYFIRNLSLFPFLTRFIYFLTFPSLPFLPE